MKRNVLSILLMTTAVLLFAGSAFGADAATVELVDSVFVRADNSVDSTVTILPQYNVYAVADSFAVDDTLLIEPPTGFKFDTSATVTATLLGTGLALDDSTLKPQALDSLFFVVKTKNDAADSVFLYGITIFPIVTTTDAGNDSSDKYLLSASKLAGPDTLGTPGTISDDTGFGEIIYLPGAADSLDWSASPAAKDAGVANSGTVELYDQFDNLTTDRTTAVTMSAVLNGTTNPGNGTLTWDSSPATGDHGGERVYAAIKYTRAENIQLAASASGCVSDTSTAFLISADVPAHITMTTSESSITVDEENILTVSVTDEYYNPVDDNKEVVFTETVGGGGVFTQYSDDYGDPEGTSPSSAVALGDDGKTKVYYDPATSYADKDVTVKVEEQSESISTTKKFTVTHTDLGNVRIYSASSDYEISDDSITDTVGTTHVFMTELLDTYGNHIPAVSLSEVSFSYGDTDEGTVTGTSIDSDGYIVTTYTLGTTALENDTITVTTTENSFDDFIEVVKISGPPATMKFLSLGDSVFVAGDGITETLSDTAWDAYDNLSDGYDLIFETDGDGIFANGLSKDTIETSGGLAEVTFRADSVAGVQTLTVSYSTVSKSFDVTVWPNEVAKVALSADPTSLVAGQVATLTLKAYDAYGIDGAGNYTVTSDSMFAAAIATFAFQDSAGTPTGAVGKGTIGTADTSAAYDYFVEYTAYTDGPDSAIIIGTLNAVSDTITLVSAANAPLGSFVIVVTDSSVAAGTDIVLEITAKDTLGITKNDYTGNVRIKLEGSAADSVNWTGDYDTTGFDVILKSVFSSGILNLNLKDRLAETGLIFSVEDTATGISKTYSVLDFYPAAVDSLPITITDSDNIFAGREFEFTVTPIDTFGNVNTAQEVKFYMTANYLDDLNLSAGARFITGPETYAITSSRVRTGQQLRISDCNSVPKKGLSPVFDVRSPDAVAPVVAITAPADSAKLNSLSVDVTGTVVDESTVTLTVNGVAVAVVDSAFVTTLTFTGEGDTVIYAEATDLFDNVGHATVSITIDTTKPVFANMTPADAADIIDQKPAISVDVTDALVGVDTSKIVMKVDDVTVAATTTAITGGYTAAYTPVADIGGGLHTVAIEASDLAGNAAYDTTSFTVSIVATKEIALAAGYNLVSIPVDPVDSTTIGSIFPDAIAIYGYEGADYVVYSDTTLVPGMSFWVASLTADTVDVVGYDIDEYTLNVVTGFNLVGALAATASFTDFEDLDGVLVSGWLYGYNAATKAYEAATTLEPGKGYWVAATDTGTIGLGAALLAKAIAASVPIPEWVGRITVNDNTYSFGKAEAAVSAFDSYDVLMPPVAPGSDNNSSYFENNNSSIFNRYLTDVRSEAGKWVFHIEKGQKARFDVSNIPAKFDVVTNIDGKQINLRKDNTIAASKAISIEVGKGLLLPEKFVLYRNYPNPFNPTTNIKFDMPTAGHVSLEVYNVLGERVRSLVNTNLNAGRYQYQWDGTNDAGINVTSGIYFYRIQAADHQKVMKMMLMK